jgi:hypothetical protein
MVESWVMSDFGTGPALRDDCPCLRDREERHRLILDAAERNSVIEGLPPFQEETRARIQQQLKAISATGSAPEPRGRSRSAADSPS